MSLVWSHNSGSAPKLAGVKKKSELLWKQQQKKQKKQTTNKTHTEQNRHCEKCQLSWRKVMAYASQWSRQYGVKHWTRSSTKKKKTSPYWKTCDGTNKTLGGNQGSIQPGAPRSPRVSRTGITNHMSETFLKTSNSHVVNRNGETERWDGIYGWNGLTEASLNSHNPLRWSCPTSL